MNDIFQTPKCVGNQYWFITEEWTEFVESSPIATLENPNPQQVRSLVRRKHNMVIAVHPVAHAVWQQASGKTDYVLTDPLLIKRELYDWVISLNQQVKQAQEGSSNGNGNLESELRAAVEDTSTAAEDSGTDSGTHLPSS